MRPEKKSTQNYELNNLQNCLFFEKEKNRKKTMETDQYKQSKTGPERE